MARRRHARYGLVGTLLPVLFAILAGGTRDVCSPVKLLLYDLLARGKHITLVLSMISQNESGLCQQLPFCYQSPRPFKITPVYCREPILVPFRIGQPLSCAAAPSGS